jgi:hypothetical protein
MHFSGFTVKHPKIKCNTFFNLFFSVRVIIQTNMLTLGTAQRSDVNDWGSNSVITEATIAGEATRITTPTIEKYDDPRRNYGFLIAVSIGRQENVFHPSHPILKPLKEEGFDLRSLPTNYEKAIQMEHNGILFRFHKRPNPVIDLHKVEPHQALANEILNTLIRTINKISTDGSYEFDLLQPVILNFSKTYDRNGRNPEFKITYPGIGGKTIHEIKTNFGNANYYAHCNVGESLLDGWLENSANQIAKSLFA